MERTKVYGACTMTMPPISVQRNCDIGLHFRVEPNVFVIWSNLKSPARRQQEKRNRRRTPFRKMVHMEWNEKVRCFRPLASPNEPTRRIFLRHYSNSVYRKNAVTDISGNTDFYPIWRANCISSVFSANVFLSLANFTIHIFTTQIMPSFVSRTPTKSHLVLRNNQGSETVLL